jgi:hypothetical protein
MVGAWNTQGRVSYSAYITPGLSSTYICNKFTKNLNYKIRVWYLKFLQRWNSMLWYPGLWHLAVWYVVYNVMEEHTASIFKAECLYVKLVHTASIWRVPDGSNLFLRNIVTISWITWCHSSEDRNVSDSKLDPLINGCTEKKNVALIFH